MRGQPWSLGRGPVLVSMLAVAFTAAAVAHHDAIVPRILPEFVFDTWPNQEYEIHSPARMNSGGLLALGIFLQTLAVLAILVLLRYGFPR
jgi:hypothetical protein